ncbi:hypothetical protein M5K25_024745 [Dendrobium thyrsiflorum]|uniref:Uncharacterized protein n=1 Tax=Dendrobium thyrsiflorum TaxID=117978 RepID=A0ABD0U2X5_DENTH
MVYNNDKYARYDKQKEADHLSKPFHGILGVVVRIALQLRCLGPFSNITIAHRHFGSTACSHSWLMFKELTATTIHPPPLNHLLSPTSHLRQPCMGDPNIDHGFLYDEQGRVDILNSPFFDVSFGNDRTVDEYVDRVIYQLTSTPARILVRCEQSVYLSESDLLSGDLYLTNHVSPSSVVERACDLLPLKPHRKSVSEGIPSSRPPLSTPPLNHLLSPTSHLRQPCMGDPNIDHGFLYDEQGRVDILNSPFFDVSFGNDRTVDKYVDRVIYQLTSTPARILVRCEQSVYLSESDLLSGDLYLTSHVSPSSVVERACDLLPLKPHRKSVSEGIPRVPNPYVQYPPLLKIVQSEARLEACLNAIRSRSTSERKHIIVYVRRTLQMD